MPRLRKEFVKIRTLIDVGVDHGTPKLYKAFRKAHLVLVDPVPGVRQRVAEVLGDRPADVIECAAGAAAGTAHLSVYERGALSTLKERTALGHSDLAPTSRIEVPVLPLDEIVEEGGYRPPFGIKIDTEGCELEVLAGAGRTLGATAFVIAELSLAPRFRDSYSFCDFVNVMNEHGFVLHDILRTAYVESTGDGSPWNGVKWIDAYFLREDLRPPVG